MSRGRKQLAAFAALVCVAAPSAAFDGLNQPQPGVKFYFSVPLDARNAKEQVMSAGFAIQGRREYEAVRIDSGLINNFIGGGVEAKWLIAGVVAAGAAVAIASKDKSTTASQNQQQNTQQAAATGTSTGTGTGTSTSGNTGGTGGGSCPVKPTCP